MVPQRRTRPDRYRADKRQLRAHQSAAVSTDFFTATQAKKSVELLERLDFIRKGTDGTFRLTRKNIRAGDELSHVDRKRFHREITELAKQSIIGSDSNLHFISSVTMGISAKTYDIIHEEALKFKNKVIEIANNDEKPDRVYQYQLNFFPLTKKNTSHE